MIDKLSFLALAISIKAKAIRMTATTVNSHEKTENKIDPWELSRTVFALKNIPAPITAPITIIIDEKKLIFFFSGALAKLFSASRFCFCNAFSLVIYLPPLLLNLSK